MVEHEIAISNKNFSDINPVSCGCQDCKPRHNFGPHIREYYLLHYVKNGCGTFERGGKRYNVEKNHIFIIPPHEVTVYTADEKNPWSYIWVGFTGSLAEKFGELEPVVNIKTNLFLEMLECESYKSCREEYLASKLFELYTKLFEDGDFSNDYVKQVCDYINANYMNDIHIADVATLVGVERTYLAKIFKEKMGMSMQSYLIDVRLRHAIHLLEHGYNVSQAAYMCGYSDNFNFSKMFKKRCGKSPQQIKMENK